MAIVIWNPTDEKFEAQYIGEFVEILPGQKIKVDDSRGKALLNTLGPRGLTSLEYGDEGDAEERKGKAARKRNFEFKKQQVIRYNQQNEAHKIEGKPYLTPPDQIKQYALDVGIKLLEPYSFGDAEVEEISRLRQDKGEQNRYIRQLEDQNKEQAEMIGKLSGTVDKLLSRVEAMEAKDAGRTQDPPSEKHAMELQEIREKLGYRTVTSRHLEGWVTRNWEALHAAPTEILEEVKQKWINLLNKPFPTEKPEVQAA